MAAWYEEYLKSKHWQKTRLRRLLAANINDEFNVIQCDREECQMWFPLGLLEVHHKTYQNLGRENLADLAVLCSSCHRVQHGFQPDVWWEELKSRNAKMVCMASVRRLRGVKHIGNVVLQCLEYHYGEIPDLAEVE